MIYVTGDLHGHIDKSKLNTKNFPEQRNLTKKDYVIICGDFGLVWNNSKQELYWRKWLDNKNFRTLFCDGNHENFELLNQYPVTEWNGGKIHKISNSIIHLMRGQVFTIDGLKFFTMGGAVSVDKESRIRGISWWEAEVPNYTEYEEGLSNLERNNWQVDYIITHTCSSDILNWISKIFGFQPKPDDSVNKYLDVIQKNSRYQHHYFGHFHEDINIDDKHTLVYEKIIRIK
ncbi:metallophosphatase [Clostridium sp. BJN0013]|uniref:metallophosphatase n=1 Tax=Clostridium sp. BJN0013 TaxID=3236840 RepID=UPI0034C6488D